MKYQGLMTLLLSLFLFVAGVCAGTEEKTRSEESRPRFQINAVRIVPTHRAAAFQKRRAVERGRRFMDDHQGTFELAEREYQVPRWVVASVLRSETNFGIHLGRRGVLKTLKTLHLYSDDDEERADYGKQLECFLQLSQQERWEDLKAIRGSSMGAIGIGQFLPCTWLAYAVDGKGEGKPDLFDPDDAIMSVANYLAALGWPKGYRRLALKRYYGGKSENYVNTVLAYANALKEG